MNPDKGLDDKGVKYVGEVVWKQLENVRDKEALSTRFSLYTSIETIKRSIRVGTLSATSSSDTLLYLLALG